MSKRGQELTEMTEMTDLYVTYELVKKQYKSGFYIDHQLLDTLFSYNNISLVRDGVTYKNISQENDDELNHIFWEALSGHKLQAIRNLKQFTGIGATHTLGLRECKNIIDCITENNDVTSRFIPLPIDKDKTMITSKDYKFNNGGWRDIAVLTLNDERMEFFYLLLDPEFIHSKRGTITGIKFGL